MRILAILILTAGLVVIPADAKAVDLEQSLRDLHAQYEAGSDPEYRVTKDNGGKTLSEAIEQVRGQTGGRILSAETKVKGNREVHHVKVLTKDGKVKTVKVQGRRRDR